MFECQFNNFQIFLFSISLGFIFAIAYEVVISSLYFLWKKIWVCYTRDILFFLTAGIFTFMFLLVVNLGGFRFFVFIGELLGWILCRFTVGNLIRFIFQTIRGKVVSMLYSIKRRISKKA